MFRDEAQKKQVESWVSPVVHIIYSVEHPCLKNPLAKNPINELGIDQYDVLEINASRENS